MTKASDLCMFAAMVLDGYVNNGEIRQIIDRVYEEHPDPRRQSVELAKALVPSALKYIERQEKKRG